MSPNAATRTRGKRRRDSRKRIADLKKAGVYLHGAAVLEELGRKGSHLHSGRFEELLTGDDTANAACLDSDSGFTRAQIAAVIVATIVEHAKPKPPGPKSMSGTEKEAVDESRKPRRGEIVKDERGIYSFQEAAHA